MFKEKLQKFKEKNSEENGNSKKKMENLVVLIIIMIVTIVAINYIWSGDKKKDNVTTDTNKKLATTENETQTVATEENGIEQKLENILSNIKGVGKTKVLITYSQTSQIIPMYDEDSSTSTTEETDSGGGTRTVNESTTKKDVIYEDKNGTKTPITQSVVNPKIEGAIITAQGANDANIKTSIVQAVEAVTGLATYKIQVFEMKD